MTKEICSEQENQEFRRKERKYNRLKNIGLALIATGFLTARRQE